MQEQLLLLVAFMALRLVETLLPVNVVADLAGALVDSHGAHLIALEVGYIAQLVDLRWTGVHQVLREVLIEAHIYTHLAVLVVFLSESLHLLVVVRFVVLHVLAHLLLSHLLRLDVGPKRQLVALSSSLIHIDTSLVHIVVSTHNVALSVRSCVHAAARLLVAAWHPGVRLDLEVAGVVCLWH